LAQVPPGVFEPVIEGKIIARLGVLLGLRVRLPRGSEPWGKRGICYPSRLKSIKVRTSLADILE
jgi:hypothetical protein